MKQQDAYEEPFCIHCRTVDPRNAADGTRQQPMNRLLLHTRSVPYYKENRQSNCKLNFNRNLFRNILYIISHCTVHIIIPCFSRVRSYTFHKFANYLQRQN